MKRLFFALFFAVIALSAAAQDLTPANNAFKKGKYDDAKNLYETTASLIKDASERQKIYDLAKKCTACKNKLAEAERLLKNRKYKEAKAAFQEVVLLNPDDPTARDGVRRITQLQEHDKADNALWAEIQQDPSWDKYNAYLSNYPSGIHAAEAQSAIENLREMQRQIEALQKEEEEAYKSFVSSRNLQAGLDYLELYEPDGKYVDKVKDLLVELYCDRHEYTKARQYSVGLKNTFIDEHEREYRKEENARAEEAAFIQFDKNRTETSARSFLDKYEYGYHSEEVAEWLVDLLCSRNSFKEARKYALNEKLEWRISEKEERYSYDNVRIGRKTSDEAAYLKEFPTGAHYDEVRDWYVSDLIALNKYYEAKQFANDEETLLRIELAEEQYFYNQYKTTQTTNDGKNYLAMYPDGPHNMEVREGVVKTLCKQHFFDEALKVAAPSKVLTSYVHKEKDSAYNQLMKETRKQELANSFDDFCFHFLDATVGYSSETDLSFGLMYSYVPKRLGFFLGGTYYLDEGFSGVAGPVVRLLNDDHAIDLQFYAGAGMNMNRSVVLDGGLRIGGREDSKFSILDLCIGVQYMENIPTIYAGVSVVLPLSLLFIML